MLGAVHLAKNCTSSLHTSKAHEHCEGKVKDHCGGMVKDQEILKEQEGRKTREKMSYEIVRTIPLMNSLQMWLSASDPHKTNPINIVS